eukprot:989525-Prorocentrum_minimum.AAC.1
MNGFGSFMNGFRSFMNGFRSFIDGLSVLMGCGAAGAGPVALAGADAKCAHVRLLQPIRRLR